MQKNIWDPLGIKNITFHPDRKPDVQNHLVHLTRRGPDDKVHWTEENYNDDRNDVNDFGGGGALGSAAEYIKILHSICANDGKLLKPETVDLMFTPQLNAQYRKHLPPGVLYSATATKLRPRNWGLGRLLLFDEETGRNEATLSWSGLPNLFWSIDRGSSLSTFYASNILPHGDPKSREMEALFQKEMYARSSKTGS